MENRSLRNVQWAPVPEGGEAVAFTGAAAGTSAQLEVGREYLVWLTDHAWVRYSSGAVLDVAAANDHPTPSGAVYAYTPTLEGFDDYLSFLAIDAAAVGCVAYIGLAERPR